MSRGICIGLMTIDRTEPNAFSERDQEVAMAFANQAAIAIDNARLFSREQAYADELKQKVSERTRELEVLYGITATAVSNPELESLVRRSLELTAAAFDCAVAAIYLLDGETTALNPVDVFTTRPESASVSLGLPDGHPALRRSLATGMALVSDGGPSDTEPPVIVTAPLRSLGRDLGVLCLLCDSAAPFSDEGLSLLMTIADQIGAAIEHIRLRQLIRQAAIIEERERLAHDIHDQVTQSIYSASLFAEAARSAAAAGNMAKVEEHTRSILRTTNLALRELRLLLFELRTEALARRGLVNALRERVRKVEQRAGISAHVHARDNGSVSDALPVAIEEAFYRIALEALNNSLRHARAGRVDLIVDVQTDEIVMTIADDGVGFDPAAAAESGGMGLESMRKRADKLGGALTVRTRPGNGTLITARAPLDPHPAIRGTA
jgi:signal transduction histidine kinase